MKSLPPANSQPHAAAQFGISALLWTTAAIALALAYLRGFGAEACVAGFEIAGVSLALGLFVGKATGQLRGGLFWSLVGAMFGFLSAAGAPVSDPILRYAWGLVGCVSALAVGVAWPHKMYRSLLLGAVAGGMTMSAVLMVSTYLDAIAWGAELRFDLLCAPVAGAWMGLAVVAVEWADRKTPTPRYVAAAGLILAVIAGNLAGAALFPWWA